ncbi:hypothetical protein Hanom_Chr02g00138881 [Helianthus anomalus]
MAEKRKVTVYGVFVMTCWRLWKARNDKIFRGVEVNVHQVVADIKTLGFLWFRSRFKDASVNWKSWCKFNLDLMLDAKLLSSRRVSLEAASLFLWGKCKTIYILPSLDPTLHLLLVGFTKYGDNDNDDD